MNNEAKIKLMQLVKKYFHCDDVDEAVDDAIKALEEQTMKSTAGRLIDAEKTPGRMSDLIDRKQAIVQLSHLQTAAEHAEDIDAELTIQKCIDCLWEIPAAQPTAQEWTHGHWIEHDELICYESQCSVCGAFNHICKIKGGCTEGDKNYCPNCGADMREDSGSE